MKQHRYYPDKPAGCSFYGNRKYKASQHYVQEEAVKCTEGVLANLNPEN